MTIDIPCYCYGYCDNLVVLLRSFCHCIFMVIVTNSVTVAITVTFTVAFVVTVTCAVIVTF